MMDIFTKECRKALSDMIASQPDSKEDVQEVSIFMILFCVLVLETQHDDIFMYIRILTK